VDAEKSDGCVMGALGTVSDMFEKYAGKLNFTIRLEVIKNAALLVCWEQVDYYQRKVLAL